MRVLTVTNPFAGLGVGDTISDPDAIRGVLAGEHAGHVVASERPDDTPAPVGRPRNKPAQE